MRKRWALLLRNHIWLCAVLVVSLSVSVHAQQASPTGGGWLHLQSPDFATFASAISSDTLDVMLQGQATFEMWLYAREPFPPAFVWILFGKDGSYRFLAHHTEIIHNPTGKIIETYFTMVGAKRPGERLNPVTYMGERAPSLNQWHHIAFVIVEPEAEAGGILFVDGKMEDRFHALPIRPSREDFFIGGGAPLDLAVEETRISNIAHYLSNFQPPYEPFEPDEHTMALWHFDERADATVFEDASGNGNTLTGHNRARIVRGKGKLSPPEEAFAVKPRNALTLLWGQIKVRNN